MRREGERRRNGEGDGRYRNSFTPEASDLLASAYQNTLICTTYRLQRAGEVFMPSIQ